MRRVALACSLLVACGGSETPAPAPMGRRANAFDVATVPLPRALCGDPAEPTIRAALAAIPPCDTDVTTWFVAGRSSAGTSVVVFWEDLRAAPPPTEDARVIVDGVPRDALPVGTPISEDDRTALAAGAILLGFRHDAIAFEQARIESVIPAGTEDYLDTITVGARPDGHVIALALLPSETESLDGPMRFTVGTFDGSVDVAGVTHVGFTPVMHTQDAGPWDVDALHDLPPIAPALRPTPLCGDPREAAVRLRVPDAPPCGATTDIVFLAAPSTRGTFVEVVWSSGDEAEVRSMAGSLLGQGPDPEPSELTLIAELMRLSQVTHLAFDTRSAETLVGNDARTVLARLDAPLGFHPTPPGATLVAIGLTTEADGTTTIAQYDVTHDGARVTDGTHRVLSLRRGSAEISGADDESTSYYSNEPFGCLDGL